MLHLTSKCSLWNNHKYKGETDSENFNVFINFLENITIELPKFELLKINWCLNCVDYYARNRAFYLDNVIYEKEVDKEWLSYLKGMLKERKSVI